MQVRKLIVGVLVSLFFISCDRDVIQPDYKVKIIGHGGLGYSSQYPLNSLESIINSYHLGADGVEIDLQLSKDGKLFLFHNEQLDGITNKNGIINSYTAAELSITVYTDYPYAQYNLLSLEDMLGAVPNPEDWKIYFDCKLFTTNYGTDFYQAFADEISKVSTQFGLQEKLIVESTDTFFLKIMHETNSNLKLCYYVQQYEDVAKFSGKSYLTEILARQESITKEEVAAAHENGWKVTSWSVKDKATLQESLDKNIDNLQVDNLRRILKLLDRY